MIFLVCFINVLDIVILLVFVDFKMMRYNSL